LWIHGEKSAVALWIGKKIVSKAVRMLV
jgi:hypothetical protein